MATRGTYQILKKNKIKVTLVKKIAEGRPNIEDRIKNGEIQLIFNTPVGKGPKFDEYKIRHQAIIHRIPIITTISGALASVNGIKAMKKGKLTVKTLQEYHQQK